MNVATISRFVLRRKALAGLAWLAIFIAAIALMPTAIGQLSDDFSMPGSESADANTAIMQRYGGVGGFSAPLVPVVDLPDGTTVDSPGVKNELAAVFAKIAEARPDARVVSWASTGDDAFVSDDRGTTFGLVYLPSTGEGIAGLHEVQQAVADQTVGGAPVLLSGRPALSEAPESSGVGVLLETLIGAGGALIVLLYIFGSLLAFLPLVIAAVSIITSFLVIGATASLIDINMVVQYMVALIGLGIAIDYSLLVVTRWREEREAGFANEMAVQRAMETAGHAVVFSGTTVGVGLLALIVLPIQM
ncbi:MAG TPA: MMPL family transporter, partial [Thermomicrobiales bacterium]|nr:MMPL family transporter [Thermomicrobiales bacterium]